MSMLLIPDTLARQAGLSEPQRQVITSSIDAMLNDLSSALIDKFNGDEVDDDEV